MANTEEYNENQFSVDDIISEFLSDNSFPSSQLPEVKTEETVSPGRGQKKSTQAPEVKKTGRKSKAGISDLRASSPKIDFSGLAGKFKRSGKAKVSYDYDDDSEADIEPAAPVKAEETSAEPAAPAGTAFESDSSEFDVYYSGADSGSRSDELSAFVNDFRAGKYIDLANEPVSEPMLEPKPDTDYIMSEKYSGDSAGSDAEDSDSSIAEEEHEAPHVQLSNTAIGRTIGNVFRRVSVNRKEYGEELEDESFANDTSEFARKREFIPSDFKQFIASEIATFVFKIKGTAEVILTTTDETEDLGREVVPKKASGYYGSFIQPLRLRFRISIVLLIILGWISLGMPVSGMLKDNRTATAVCLGIQLVIMLLSLDVISNAIMNTFRGRVGFDFLASISCVITSLDAAFVAAAKLANEHLALCFISSLSLVGVLASSFLYAKGLRKSIRVPAIARKEYSVTSEYNAKEHEISMLKSGRPVVDFIRRSEQVSPDENMYEKLSIFILAASFLLSFILAAVKKDFADFLYLYSAVLCPAVPVCGLLCFIVPFFAGTDRLFTYGTAIAGWSGVYDLGHSKKIIITDNDLFPDGTVDITDIKIAGPYNSEQTVGYLGSMIIASGSCIAKPISDYMAHSGITTYPVENFEILPSGGFKGIINRKVIYCGGIGFMRLQGFKIPASKVKEYSVLIAEDGKISGILNIEYKGLPEVREALAKLISSDRTPVFAVRDFNISQNMLHDIFDLPTDGYNFPPYAERFSVSTPAVKDDTQNVSQIAAVVCKDGLRPLAELSDMGSKIYKTVRMNLFITIPGSILCAVIVFFKLLVSGSVSILFLFILSLILSIPVIVRSMFLRY